VIGNNITIYHLVTIGVNENKCFKKDRNCVVIEDNCYISAGAKIISARVGKNCKIGANAVVFEDIPDNSMVFNSVEYKC
jgi:serine O-acetyltransferase